jgi:Flp pilus assembly protein TadG
MTIGQRSSGVREQSSILRNFRLLGFREDSRGAAGLEFALVLPFALVLFTGAVTYGDAIAIDRKVTLTTRSVTDLVTQYQSISKADLQTLLDSASSAIVAPYSATPLVVTVSQVTTDSHGNATIAWTQSTTAGAADVHRPGDTVSLPTQIDTPQASYIWGEVVYTYTPTIGYQVTGPLVLTDQTYMSPRLVAQIPAPQ